ncbi:MAG: 50S ribosomal protein L29 [Candidatus Omnitrophica bacterium]|nr:50S ribosomal protein L29 [Candidatus Omnitrophota bacterium]
MKVSELKELNEDELRNKLAGFKKELFDLRMDRAAGKLAKPHRMQLLRRDSARALTLLRQKEAPKQEAR